MSNPKEDWGQLNNQVVGAESFPADQNYVRDLEQQIATLQGEAKRLEADAAAKIKALELAFEYAKQFVLPPKQQKNSQDQRLYDAIKQALSTAAGRSLLERLERYEKALKELAILGNEPLEGNSIGNRIAQKALKGGDK